MFGSANLRQGYIHIFGEVRSCDVGLGKEFIFTVGFGPVVSGAARLGEAMFGKVFHNSQVRSGAVYYCWAWQSSVRHRCGWFGKVS